MKNLERQTGVEGMKAGKMPQNLGTKNPADSRRRGGSGKKVDKTKGKKKY